MEPPFEEMNKEVAKKVIIAEDKSIVDAGVLGIYY
jgi:hypothetical protein